MNQTSVYDTDGDGLIENSGFADQTYDAWPVTGPRYAFVALFLPLLSQVISFYKKGKCKVCTRAKWPTMFQNTTPDKSTTQ